VTVHTVTGLVDGQQYFFVATAHDSLGNESGYSNEVVHGSGVTRAEINVLGNARASSTATRRPRPPTTPTSAARTSPAAP